MSHDFAILQKNIIFNPKWQNYPVAGGERWYLNKGQIKSGGEYNTWCIRIFRINSEDLWGPWQFYQLFLLLFTLSLNSWIYVIFQHSIQHSPHPPTHHSHLKLSIAYQPWEQKGPNPHSLSTTKTSLLRWLIPLHPIFLCEVLDLSVKWISPRRISGNPHKIAL